VKRTSDVWVILELPKIWSMLSLSVWVRITNLLNVMNSNYKRVWFQEHIWNTLASFANRCNFLSEGLFRWIHNIVESDYLLCHVCPPVCMGQLGSHRMDFHEIWYLSSFKKSVQKIQVLLKPDKNNRYFTWKPVYIFDHTSLNSS